MFEKRGQEGVTLTTLILIIIGAVVAVVIILGATGALDTIFGKKDVLPGNLGVATQACKLAAQNNFISDYCYDFKKLDDYEYVNCDDARIQDSFTQQGVSTTNIKCNPGLVVEAVANECRDFSTTQKTKTVFKYFEVSDGACAVESGTSGANAEKTRRAG